MGFLPDESRALKPPGLVNRNSVWIGWMGWASAILQNALSRRPPFRSGIHRQVLSITIGWYLGYQISRYEDYSFAKRDREMYAYINQHPELFPKTVKKTFAEIVEPFFPVR